MKRLNRFFLYAIIFTLILFALSSFIGCTSSSEEPLNTYRVVYEMDNTVYVDTVKAHYYTVFKQQTVEFQLFGDGYPPIVQYKFGNNTTYLIIKL